MTTRTINGKIREVFQDTDERYAFYIGEEPDRISGFGTCPYTKGHTVTVTVKEGVVNQKTGRPFLNHVDGQTTIGRDSFTKPKHDMIHVMVAVKAAAIELNGKAPIPKARVKMVEIYLDIIESYI